MLHASMSMKHRSSCVCLTCRQAGCSNIQLMWRSYLLTALMVGKGPEKSMLHSCDMTREDRSSVSSSWRSGTVQMLACTWRSLAIVYDAHEGVWAAEDGLLAYLCCLIEGRNEPSPP